MKTIVQLLAILAAVAFHNLCQGQTTEYLTFINPDGVEIGQGISYDESKKEIVSQTHIRASGTHQLDYSCKNWYGTSWYYVPLAVPSNATKLTIEFPSIQLIRKPAYDGNAPKLFSYIVADRLPNTKNDIDYIRGTNLWKREYGTSNKKNLKVIPNITGNIEGASLDDVRGNVIYIVYRVAHSWKNNYSMTLQIASPEITWTTN